MFMFKRKQEEPQGYIILAEFTFNEKNLQEALELLDEVENQELDNDDCIYYEVAYSKEEPTRVFIYKSYEDEKAFNAYRNSTHFKQLVEGKVIPMTETAKVTRLVPLE